MAGAGAAAALAVQMLCASETDDVHGASMLRAGRQAGGGAPSSPSQAALPGPALPASPMDNNKENQEQAEDAPTDIPSVASPRISSVGASEDPAGSSRQPEQFHDPQAYELTSGHDHLHWGGVGRRVGQQPHDTRSIASSAATRDDKSIYEEPGALDATEGGRWCTSFWSSAQISLTAALLRLSRVCRGRGTHR